MKATIQYSEKKYGTGSNADQYTLEVEPDVRIIYRNIETPEGEEGYEEHSLNELIFKFKFNSAADGISDNFESTAVVKEVHLSLGYSAAQQLAKAINYMVFKHELTGSTEGVKLEITEGIPDD